MFGNPDLLSYDSADPVMILRDERVVKMSAVEIVRGDAVLIAKLPRKAGQSSINLRSMAVDGTLLLDPTGTRMTVKQRTLGSRRPASGNRWVPLDIVADREFGRLIGHFFAEGNLNSNKRGRIGVETCSHTNELSILEETQRTYHARFGCYSRITAAKVGHSSRLRVTSQALALTFEWLFYNQTGKKKLPLSMILDAGDEFRKRNH